MALPVSRYAVLCALFTLFICSVSAPTQADDARTAQLESVFSDLIDRYRQAAASNGATLETQGDVLVEPNGRFHAVTLPHMTLRQQDGAYTEIGMIALNAMAGEQPEELKVTLALPTPIIHYDEAATPLTTIDIGSQSFAGVWHTAFNNFVKIKANYKDIAVADHLEGTQVTIPDTAILFDLSEDANGLWSGPADFILSGMDIRLDQTGARARMEEFKVTSRIEQYDLDAIMRYEENLTALAESYEAGDTPSASGPHILGLYNLITGFIGEAWDAFDFTVALKGFTLTTPPIPGSPEGNMTIANGAFGFGMNGFRAGSVNMNFDLSYDGFSMSPQTEDYNQATPDRMNIALSINSLPYKEMVELGKSSIESGAQSPGAAQMVGLQALMVMPQLLTQAQTNLKLEDGFIGNEQYDVKMNATFTADLNAQMGVTGQSSTAIYGLDNLISSLQAAASNEDIDVGQRAKIAESLKTLGVIKMVGQMGQDDQGRDVRNYEFELNPQGQMMLNGTDLQTILQSQGQ